LSSFD